MIKNSNIFSNDQNDNNIGIGKQNQNWGTLQEMGALQRRSNNQEKWNSETMQVNNNKCIDINSQTDTMTQLNLEKYIQKMSQNDRLSILQKLQNQYDSLSTNSVKEGSSNFGQSLRFESGTYHQSNDNNSFDTLNFREIMMLDQQQQPIEVFTNQTREGEKLKVSQQFNAETIQRDNSSNFQTKSPINYNYPLDRGSSIHKSQISQNNTIYEQNGSSPLRNKSKTKSNQLYPNNETNQTKNKAEVAKIIKQRLNSSSFTDTEFDRILGIDIEGKHQQQMSSYTNNSHIATEDGEITLKINELIEKIQQKKMEELADKIVNTSDYQDTLKSTLNNPNLLQNQLDQNNHRQSDEFKSNINHLRLDTFDREDSLESNKFSLKRNSVKNINSSNKSQSNQNLKRNLNESFNMKIEGKQNNNVNQQQRNFSFSEMNGTPNSQQEGYNTHDDKIKTEELLQDLQSDSQSHQQISIADDDDLENDLQTQEIDDQLNQYLRIQDSIDVLEVKENSRNGCQQQQQSAPKTTSFNLSTSQGRNQSYLSFLKNEETNKKSMQNYSIASSTQKLGTSYINNNSKIYFLGFKCSEEQTTRFKLTRLLKFLSNQAQKLEFQIKLYLFNARIKKEEQQKSKIKLKIQLDKFKQQEQLRVNTLIKEYEKSIDEKWQLKEREIRVDEFTKYGGYVQAERNELKRQLKELESRYQSKIKSMQIEHLESQKQREEAVHLKYQIDINELKSQVEDLKRQRDIQAEQQSQLIIRQQNEVQERVQRVLNDEQGKNANVENERNKLKNQVEIMQDRINELLRECNETKDLNLNMAKAQSKQNQNGSCNQCGVLMLANEQLIGRLKKYETMLRYKNSKNRMSLLNGSTMAIGEAGSSTYNNHDGYTPNKENINNISSSVGMYKINKNKMNNIK
eukprot:403373283